MCCFISIFSVKKEMARLISANVKHVFFLLTVLFPVTLAKGILHIVNYFYKMMRF